MLQCNRLQAATLFAALIPAFAFADIETLIIQVGKDKAILDTVIIQVEYGKPPEVAHPNGVAWESLEKDTAWNDADGQHHELNHAFRAAMDGRKGYGVDYIISTLNGDAIPRYTAVVSFSFPGQTTLTYYWETVHMTFQGYGAQFLSGSQVYGQVSEYAGTGGENLRQGQWALLLTRKRERPASVNTPMIPPGKETLRIQIGTDGKILDTVVLWTRYDTPPEIPNPNGGDWPGLEKDSTWMDSEGMHYRYSHSFLAMQGAKKGFGVDYVSFVDNPEVFSPGEPILNANLGFIFPGDTSENIGWDPMHMVDMPKAYPFEESGFVPGSGAYGEVSRFTEKGNDLAPGHWAKLIGRERGWIGYELPSALTPRAKAVGRGDGWLVNLARGAVLQVPTGAKGVQVFDVRGQLHWKARNLVEGASLALPGRLPQGALRYRWKTGPG